MANCINDIGSVTIASGDSLSGAFGIGELFLLGLNLPAAWTTANLTLQDSQDGVTYYDIYDKDGNEVVISAAASRGIRWTQSQAIRALRSFKLRSGTSGTPVTQAGDRVIRILAGSL